MSCPNCGAELADMGGKRVKWKTPMGKSRSAQGARTKFKRVWKCANCGRFFAILTTFREVELSE